MPSIVSLNDINDPRTSIREYIHLSPCNLSPHLSEGLDCKLYLKLEHLQRTGAYKDRGATNAVLTLDEAHKKAGVIAASAGNHAQGLAFAAQRNNVHATIVMPRVGPERPTSIVDLDTTAATQQINILSIHHGRTFTSRFLSRDVNRVDARNAGPEAVQSLFTDDGSKRLSGAIFHIE